MRDKEVEAGDGFYLSLIQAAYRIAGQVEKKFDALRESDREAVRVAQDELSRRLEGFPQQFATKTEMQETARTLARLEKDALSREAYEQNHEILAKATTALAKEKLDTTVFSTFIENYRIEQERAAAERRDVAEVLSQATERVRAQILEERGEFLTQESYAEQHRTLVVQIESVEKWQYKIVGGLVFATFLAPLVTGLVVYIFTKEF